MGKQYMVLKHTARGRTSREESAGGHFREESQTEDGEALRDDEELRHLEIV